VPEIIDPVFTKTSQNARILLSENERFGLVFVKTGSINSGTVVLIVDNIFIYSVLFQTPTFEHCKWKLYEIRIKNQTAAWFSAKILHLNFVFIMENINNCVLANCRR
jgi:hypothetical protein